MLSPDYHLAYWGVSAPAAAIYHVLTSVLGVPVEPLELLFVIFGLIALYIIFKGPRKESWPFPYQYVTAGLMISVGTLTKYMVIPDENAAAYKAAFHMALAFEVAGTLESIRQDRRDIEPCSVGVAVLSPRTDLCRLKWQNLIALPASYFIFSRLRTIVDFLKDEVVHAMLNDRGKWSWNTICLVNLVSDSSDAHGVIVAMYIFAAQADVAETIFYVCCRNMIPTWTDWVPQAQTMTTPGLEWSMFSPQASKTALWLVGFVFGSTPEPSTSED